EEASRRALAEMCHSDLLTNDLREVERPVPREPVLFGADNRRDLTAGIWDDLRYGLRRLMKEYRITIVVVVTMALGIGANTTVFSTLELLVFRPFAFTNQQRLLMLGEQQPAAGIRRGPVAPGNFNDWREQNQTFE